MQDSPCTAAIRVGCARAGLDVVQGSRSGLNSVSWPRGSGASLGWQYLMYVLCTWELIPRSCFRRRREAREGGLIDFLIKVVRRPLRTKIEPLMGSALSAFPAVNLASLTIVDCRRASVCLSVCRFVFAAC